MKHWPAPLTVIVEIDFTDYGNRRIEWRPGWFKEAFRDGYFCRVWWLCFAVAWVRMPLHEYNRYIESGAAEWIVPDRPQKDKQ